MTQTGLDPKKVQAIFYFVCADPNKLTSEAAHEAMLATFEVAGVSTHQELYDNYVAFVEDNGKSPDAGKGLLPLKYSLPGISFRFNIMKADGVLQEKHRHEAAHLRKPGHVSTVAPKFLTAKTLVMIIGSRPFLATHACLYLERHGVLRDVLIPLLVSIAGLAERKGGKKNTYIQATICEEAFYPGNFDAMLEDVRKSRMSTRELIDTLGQE